MAKLPTVDQLLRKQRKKFIKRFGREPKPGEPVIFDECAPGDAPQFVDADAMRAEVIKAMAQGGTPPEIVYAFSKAGLLIVDWVSNSTPAVRAEWSAAITEYVRLEAKARGS